MSKTKLPRRGMIVVLAAALVIGVVVAVGYSLSSRKGSAAPVAVAQGPQPPAKGAYFGAWSKPEPLSQPGRVNAINNLESMLGRPLDITHVYKKWTDPFPKESDQVFLGRGLVQLSWAGTDTQRIASGAEDNAIRTRAQEIKSVGVPILLEWRWEMDRPNLQAEVHSPADYIAAWRHIRAIFDAEGVHNAGWVWCPTAEGFASGRAQAYYPGDAQVDWVCVDAYPAVTRPGVDPNDSLADLLQPFLNWAHAHPRPVIIGEFGVPQSYSPTERARWLGDAASALKADPQIKAAVYYDENPEGKPPRYAYAIGADPRVQQALRALADDPYFQPPRPVIK